MTNRLTRCRVSRPPIEHRRFSIHERRFYAHCQLARMNIGRNRAILIGVANDYVALYPVLRYPRSEKPSMSAVCPVLLLMKVARSITSPLSHNERIFAETSRTSADDLPDLTRPPDFRIILTGGVYPARAAVTPRALPFCGRRAAPANMPYSYRTANYNHLCGL